MVLWLVPSQWKTGVNCLLWLRSARVRLSVCPLLPIKPSLWRRRRVTVQSLSSSSTILSSSPCLENLESPDANLNYRPFYKSACQDIHRMMVDLGAAIHTVGPGMESLSHGSLGLFPPGGVSWCVAGWPRAYDSWRRQSSVPVLMNCPRTRYLITHTPTVGTNPTLNTLFSLELVWQSRNEHRGESWFSVTQSRWSGRRTIATILSVPPASPYPLSLQINQYGNFCLFIYIFVHNLLYVYIMRWYLILQL